MRIVYILVLLAIAVPVVVFSFPDQTFYVLDNIPVKALLSASIFLILACASLFLRILTAEVTAAKAALRAWQASLAGATATVSHPLFPINDFTVTRSGFRILFHGGSHTPTMATVAVAFGILFVFTAFFCYYIRCHICLVDRFLA